MRFGCLGSYARLSHLGLACDSKLGLEAVNFIIRNRLHSGTQRQLPLPANIKDIVKVTDFNCEVSRERRPAKENYSDNAFLMQNALFEATATVIVPALSSEQNWNLGFIQASDYLTANMTYGQYGSVVRTVPGIYRGSGKMINDKVNGNPSPWHDSVRSMVQLRGPCPEYKIKINMTDEPLLKVRWMFNGGRVMPTSRSQNMYDGLQRLCDRLSLYHLCDGSLSGVLPTVNYRDAYLTHVTRTQGFYSWLIIRCAYTGDFQVLKTIRWDYTDSVRVDCTQPIGQRVLSLDDENRRTAKVLEDNFDVPFNVMRPPSLNEAAKLTWHPTKGNRAPVTLQEPTRRVQRLK